VRNHLGNILEKLGLDNRVQVATFALKQGIGRKPGAAG
jgi:two-component system nitrate/nitrite response regulator NarL